MKEIINQFGFQGDVQVFSMKTLPEKLEEIEKTYIAESSTSGSFHALFGKYTQYRVKNGFVVDVKEECILNHSLKKELENTTMDVKKILKKKYHNHCVIPKGIYFLGIQQKFDPLKGLKEKVRD